MRPFSDSLSSGDVVTFDRIARVVEARVGSPAAFYAAGATLLVWLVSGPIFGFSDTWQLVINTLTTIITFLMVFLIQNTQTRDTQAIHIKLDELIRVTEARNSLISLEDRPQDEALQIKDELGRLTNGSVRRG